MNRIAPMTSRITPIVVRMPRCRKIPSKSRITPKMIIGTPGGRGEMPVRKTLTRPRLRLINVSTCAALPPSEPGHLGPRLVGHLGVDHHRVLPGLQRARRGEVAPPAGQSVGD